MNQEKIGTFISELRREHGITQRDLAEKIGVSDKTISKWETGRSIPDLLYMDDLCNALMVSANELISGERLSEESYAVKAEENILNLISENESRKKGTLILSVVGAVLCVMAFLTIILYGYGYDSMMKGLLFYLDFPTFMIMTAASAGCVLLSGKRTLMEILVVLRRTSLPCGCIATFMTFVFVLHDLPVAESTGRPIAVALLFMIYAFIEYLTVVLIQERISHG